MKKDQILKGYLLHFIYVPFAIINALINGEDGGTVGHIAFIIIILGMTFFFINYSITHLSLSMFKSIPIVAFVLPTIIQLVLYIPIDHLLNNLDFGGESGYLTFLVVSAIINLGVYIVLVKIRIKTGTNTRL